MSTVVVLNGLLLGAPRHHIIIKLAPLERERYRKNDGQEGGGGGEMRRIGEQEWGKKYRGKEKTREHLR